MKSSCVIFLLSALLSFSSFARAEENSMHARMINCHEALFPRSDGTSDKMVLEHPIPFVFTSGKNFLFVTDTSIAVLDNAKSTYNDQKFVVPLTSKDQEILYEVNVGKTGKLGSVCCTRGLAKDFPETAVASPTSRLTKETRNALKTELRTRLQTVEGSYQNKDAQMQTADALRNCKGLGLGPIVERLIQKYEAKTDAYAGKKPAPMKSKTSSSGGSR